MGNLPSATLHTPKQPGPCPPVPPASQLCEGRPCCVCVLMGFFQYCGFVINCTPACCLLEPQAKPGAGWHSSFPPPGSGAWGYLHCCHLARWNRVRLWVLQVGPPPPFLASLPLWHVSSPILPSLIYESRLSVSPAHSHRHAHGGCAVLHDTGGGGIQNILTLDVQSHFIGGKPVSTGAQLTPCSWGLYRSCSPLPPLVCAPAPHLPAGPGLSHRHWPCPRQDPQ